MSETEFTLSLPLDSQGFLRRACPDCGREFKWLPAENDGDVPTTAYFCPYRGTPAAPDEWFTSEQLAYIEAQAFDQVVTPSLGDLSEAIQGLEEASGGLIRASIQLPHHEQAPPIFEPDDMQRVQLPCHPEEPIKVLETWGGAVHCLICGQVPGASSP